MVMEQQLTEQEHLQVRIANGGAGGPSCQTPTAGGGNGSIGVVILTYPDSKTITIGAGLTGTTAAPSGGFKTTTLTAGTGNVSWS